MALESALIPIPSEIIMPFAGFLVWEGTFSFMTVVLWGALGNLAGSIIAYFLGFYDRLIAIFRNLNVECFKKVLKGQMRPLIKALDLSFSIPLFSGIALSFIRLTRLFSLCVNDRLGSVLLRAVFLSRPSCVVKTSIIWVEMRR